MEEHRIRGYEVGPDQKTTITTMANLLQVLCPLPYPPPPPHRANSLYASVVLAYLVTNCALMYCQLRLSSFSVNSRAQPFQSNTKMRLRMQALTRCPAPGNIYFRVLSC